MKIVDTINGKFRITNSLFESILKNSPEILFERMESDNGYKFSSDEIKDYAKKNGIKLDGKNFNKVVSIFLDSKKNPSDKKSSENKSLKQVKKDSNKNVSNKTNVSDAISTAVGADNYNKLSNDKKKEYEKVFSDSLKKNNGDEGKAYDDLGKVLKQDYEKNNGGNNPNNGGNPNNNNNNEMLSTLNPEDGGNNNNNPDPNNGGNPNNNRNSNGYEYGTQTATAIMDPDGNDDENDNELKKLLRQCREYIKKYIINNVDMEDNGDNNKNNLINNIITFFNNNVRNKVTEIYNNQRENKLTNDDKNFIINVRNKIITNLHKTYNKNNTNENLLDRFNIDNNNKRITEENFKKYIFKVYLNLFEGNDELTETAVNRFMNDIKNHYGHTYTDIFPKEKKTINSLFNSVVNECKKMKKLLDAVNKG